MLYKCTGKLLQQLLGAISTTLSADFEVTDQILHYTSFNFVGIEFSSSIDASAMTHLHADIFIPNALTGNAQMRLNWLILEQQSAALLRQPSRLANRSNGSAWIFPCQACRSERKKQSRQLILWMAMKTYQASMPTIFIFTRTAPSHRRRQLQRRYPPTRQCDQRFQRFIHGNTRHRPQSVLGTGNGCYNGTNSGE